LKFPRLQPLATLRPALQELQELQAQQALERQVPPVRWLRVRLPEELLLEQLEQLEQLELQELQEPQVLRLQGQGE
tara:strand:- start:173 stop:400 length:228 start_codon:yes stop_codon:yes gene_type:complete